MSVDTQLLLLVEDEDHTKVAVVEIGPQSGGVQIICKEGKRSSTEILNYEEEKLISDTIKIYQKNI